MVIVSVLLELDGKSKVSLKKTRFTIMPAPIISTTVAMMETTLLMVSYFAAIFSWNLLLSKPIMISSPKSITGTPI